MAAELNTDGFAALSVYVLGRTSQQVVFDSMLAQEMTTCWLTTLGKYSIIVSEWLQSLFICCSLARESTWLISGSALQKSLLAGPLVNHPHN